MPKDQKRQIKKEKIIETFKSANYSIINWYINTSNIVLACLVRNDINNIDFICYIPSNILMTVENGIYCTKMSSPDFDQSIQMWNEIKLESIAVQVFRGIIFKKDKEWECYSTSSEKKSTETDSIDTNYIGLDESNAKVVKPETSVQIEIVGVKENPFDVILDGGDYKANGMNSRVEDSQPSVLINYKGFTYGQAVSLVNIMTFTNSIKGFELKLAEWNKEILTFQFAKIKQNGTEAVQLITKFKESLEKSLKEWNDEWETSTELLSRVQNVLELSYEKKNVNDMSTKANTALRETTEKILSKRDSLLGLLTTCLQLFHQV